MNKLPLLVALGAASLASVAQAQGVEVYGRLYPYLSNQAGSGASTVGTPVSTLAATATGTEGIKAHSYLLSGNSNLGVRGSKAFGEVRAEFQIEGTVAVQNGNSDGFQWNRNTFVGLGNNWGTVRLGLIDTIFKNYGDTLGMLGVSSGTHMSSSSVLRKTGFGTSSASSFHLRRSNSIQIESAEFGGLQAGAQYSSDQAAAGTRDPKVLSFGVKYDLGPVYFALAHEIHDDLFGGSINAPAALRNNAVADTTNSKDKATEFTVEYRLTKQHKFEFDFIRKEYKENATVAGRFVSYTNNAILLAADNRWGERWRTGVQFVKASAGSCTRVAAACDTTGLDGTKFSLGAAYYFDKSLYVFGNYDLLRNGAAARYNNSDSTERPNPGEDIRHVAIGVSYAF